MPQIQHNKKQEQKQKENMREMKGRHLATSRRVYRLKNSDTFYVESESTNDLYYFVRYEPSFQWCSCLDNSTRHIKCKHIFGIEFAIMKGTLKEVERLPKEAKRDNQLTKEQHEQLLLESNEVIEAISYNSYREDEYSF
jgi:hypothetical protein